MKRWSTTILAVALTALLLGYALRGVDFPTLGDVLAGADYRYAAPFVATLALFFFLKAWRWTHILAPLGRYTIQQAAPPMMIGFAANNVLPAHLGELVRSLWFARRYGERVSAVLTTQILERILDVAAIVVLYLLAVPWIDDPPEALRISVWLVGASCALAAGMIYALLTSPERVFRLWRWASARLPASFRTRGEGFLGDVLRALSSVQSGRRLLALVTNSVVQWSLMGVCVWMSMAAMGVAIGPALSLIVLTATVVAVALPSAPGYVGALQAAFVFALEPFGVSSEAALAGSVFYLVGNWVPITTAGGLCALTWRTHPRASAFGG